METFQIDKAVAYYRVSSDKQVNDGNGLDSQQWSCEAWAKRNGYKIDRFFIDAAKTGTKTAGRDQLAEMIDYLSKIKEPRLVLFYDISRLARNAGDFLKLRKAIEQKGHKLATCKGVLENTPVGKFVATIEAANAELFADQNRERTITGMREAARNGYWITQPPKGYQFIKVGARKELKRLEPLASIIQSAQEQFASAKLVSQTDVVNFLTEQMRCAGLSVPRNVFDYVKRILTDRKYTGIFAYPKYDIPVQKWHIEPLISTETFNLIQDRMAGRNRIKHKKYNKNDPSFPLKGFITCPECGFPLTGSGTKGGKYPYYQCQNRKCPKKALANISPDNLHREFESEILNKIAPNENVIALARALGNKEYTERNKSASMNTDTKKKRILAICDEQVLITDSYIRATSDIMRNALTAKIDSLEYEKLTLQSEIDNHQDELMPFNDAFGYVADFISRPIEAWKHGTYAIKQLVLNLCFSDRLSYNKADKFGTVHLSPIFGMFNTFSGDNSLMVPAARIGLAPRPYQGRVLPLYYAGDAPYYNRPHINCNDFCFT